MDSMKGSESRRQTYIQRENGEMEGQNKDHLENLLLGTDPNPIMDPTAALLRDDIQQGYCLHSGG
jgi:hypothetical protein